MLNFDPFPMRTRAQILKPPLYAVEYQATWQRRRSNSVKNTFRRIPTTGLLGRARSGTCFFKPDQVHQFKGYHKNADTSSDKYNDPRRPAGEDF